MKATQNLSINKNGASYSIPDPMVFSEAAMKDAMLNNKTGILAVYDPVSMAGGIISPNIESPSWMIFLPITKEEFTAEINMTLNQIIQDNSGVH